MQKTLEGNGIHFEEQNILLHGGWQMIAAEAVMVLTKLAEEADPSEQPAVAGHTRLLSTPCAV